MNFEKTKSIAVLAWAWIVDKSKKIYTVIKKEFVRTNNPRTWRDKVGSVLKYTALALVILGFALSVTIDAVIKKSVETIGPMVLKVPVTLSSVYFAPLRGKFFLTDLTIGNPEGYRNRELFKFKRFVVDIDYSYLLQNTVMINEITLEGMRADVEFNWKFDSNISKLLKDMSPGQKAPPPPAPKDSQAPQPEAADSAKDENPTKIIIRKLRISDSQIDIGYAGVILPIPLVPVAIDNIGESYDITGAIYNVISKIGDVIVSVSKEAVKKL